MMIQKPHVVVPAFSHREVTFDGEGRSCALRRATEVVVPRKASRVCLMTASVALSSRECRGDMALRA